MPFYEYRCDACDHGFEALQKISDAPLETCPVCHETALRKLISAAGFRLKGQGWYETDFKSNNQRNLADTSKKSEAATSTASSTKTDS